jgi:hypothetical protein
VTSEYPGPPPTQPPGYGQQYPPPRYGQQYPPPGYGQQYPPPYGPPPGAPEPGVKDGWQDSPRALRPVVVLLLVNLGLSLLLTIVTVLARHSIVNYQLDHRHIVDPDQRALLRDSYTYGIIGRVVGNIVVSVIYVFLVRALLRGRRWAYRRVILLGAVGIFGLLLLQATPYPAWMRVEQLLQAVVLAALLYFVLRPEVKAHFDPRLPGRNARRFQR